MTIESLVWYFENLNKFRLIKETFIDFIKENTDGKTLIYKFKCNQYVYFSSIIISLIYQW